MSEIKFKFIEKIAVLSKSASGWTKNPLHPLDTSPQIFQIWGEEGWGSE